MWSMYYLTCLEKAPMESLGVFHRDFVIVIHLCPCEVKSDTQESKWSKPLQGGTSNHREVLPEVQQDSNAT